MYPKTDRWQELRGLADGTRGEAEAVKRRKQEEAKAELRKLFKENKMNFAVGGVVLAVVLFLLSVVVWPKAAAVIVFVGLLFFFIVAPLGTVVAGIFMGIFCPKTAAKMAEQERRAMEEREKELEAEEALMCPLKKAEKEEEERRRRIIYGYGAIM